MFQISR